MPKSDGRLEGGEVDLVVPFTHPLPSIHQIWYDAIYSENTHLLLQRHSLGEEPSLPLCPCNEMDKVNRSKGSWF
jgi:hypothetical protein